jgi:hypothetical protein
LQCITISTTTRRNGGRIVSPKMAEKGIVDLTEETETSQTQEGFRMI